MRKIGLSCTLLLLAIPGFGSTIMCAGLSSQGTVVGIYDSLGTSAFSAGCQALDSRSVRLDILLPNRTNTLTFPVEPYGFNSTWEFAGQHGTVFDLSENPVRSIGFNTAGTRLGFTSIVPFTRFVPTDGALPGFPNRWHRPHDSHSKVPEPGSMMLLASGLVGFAGMARRGFRK